MRKIFMRCNYALSYCAVAVAIRRKKTLMFSANFFQKSQPVKCLL